MSKTAAIAAALVGLAACTPDGRAASNCEKLCRELVQNCEFAAYPEFGSCMEGCAYNETEGGDIAAQLTCVEAAACDQFAIVECENAHGPQ